MSKRQHPTEARLLLLAAVFLILGVAVYAFDRSAPPLFLPAWLSAGAGSGESGALGASLPALLHTSAMILITAAILRPWPRHLACSCAAWFAVESLFEIGQGAPLDGRIAAALPSWFGDLPVLDVAGDYFVAGTYDPMDLAAIGFGTFAAYFLVRHIYRGAER